MRNPIFATSLGLIKYMGEQDEINLVAKKKTGKPVYEAAKVVPLQQKQQKPVHVQNDQSYTQETEEMTGEEKPSFIEQAKQFIQSIFE